MAAPFPFPCPALEVFMPAWLGKAEMHTAASMLTPPASATPAPVSPQAIPAVEARMTRPATLVAATVPSLTALDRALYALGADGRSERLALWPHSEQHIMLSFLNRLLQDGEAAISVLRLKLGLRVQRLLDAACANAGFRQQAMALVQTALTNYGHRVIRGVDDLEAALDIEQALASTIPQATLALVQLSYGVMRLQIVRARAAHHCTLAPHLNANEIYYAYETQLRERLCLPGGTVSPIHSSVVPRRYIDVAAVAAETVSNDVHGRKAFFASWPPWLRLQRLTQAAKATYGELPVRRRLLHPASKVISCPLTRKTERALEHGVYLGDGEATRTFEYERLLAYWVTHGTEPETGEPMTLEQLWRTAS